jgi:membrane associated rhomboid family serine protease
MHARDYQDVYARPGLGRGCKTLLIVTLAAFVVQILGDLSTGGQFTRMFGLSMRGMQRLYAWQLLTYMFLHSKFFIFHVLFNMIGLYVFGRDVEDMIGTARFVILYLLCGFLGGLFWLVAAAPNQTCIGASGAVFGLLGTYAAFFPDRRITLLVFFILPVTLTARMLAIGFGLVSLLSVISGSDGGVAHMAHLAGGVAGYLYGWRTKKSKGFLFGTEWSRWSPFRQGVFSGVRAEMRRRNIKLMDPDPGYRPEQKEVDEILEKVNMRGMSSLTRWERQVLDRASRNGIK